MFWFRYGIHIFACSLDAMPIISLSLFQYLSVGIGVCVCVCVCAYLALRTHLAAKMPEHQPKILTRATHTHLGPRTPHTHKHTHAWIAHRHENIFRRITIAWCSRSVYLWEWMCVVGVVRIAVWYTKSVVVDYKRRQRTKQQQQVFVLGQSSRRILLCTLLVG